MGFDLPGLACDGEPSLAEAHRTVTRLLSDAAIETPALDARRLVAAACGIPTGNIVLRPEERMGVGQITRLQAFVARRLRHEPVARILGERTFYGLELEVTPATLDPRPETETLVDGVLDLVREGLVPNAKAPRILDVGTGTGAILLALLVEIPEASGVAVDVDANALAVAERNAVRLGLRDRISVCQSNWLEGVSEMFDLIVSNPPYIPTGAIGQLERDVRLYDPRLALEGGEDGLAAYRSLIPAAVRHLAVGGWLAVEVGDGQAVDVARLAEAVVRMATRSAVARSWLDLSGKPRCVAIQHQ